MASSKVQAGWHDKVPRLLGCPIMIQAIVDILHCIISCLIFNFDSLTCSLALTMASGQRSGFPKFLSFLSFLHFLSLCEHYQLDREWIVHSLLRFWVRSGEQPLLLSKHLVATTCTPRLEWEERCHAQTFHFNSYDDWTMHWIHFQAERSLI